MINDTLTPKERAIVLRSVGLDIRKNKGQISNIKNVAYNDKTPSLNINLDTGMVKDFGKRGMDYNGDVFTLVGAILQKNFAETVDYFGKVLNRNLRDEYPAEFRTKMKSEEELKIEAMRSAENFKFWNKAYNTRMRKCQKVLNDIGIHKDAKYIEEYDMIDLATLKKFGCGYYGFDDMEFGLSDFRGKKILRYIFPYQTGAMLYRRVDNDKEVRHIKGSKAMYSFFGGTMEFAHDRLLIMKSPRETMLANLLFGFFCDTIGLATGENIVDLYPLQVKTLNRFIESAKEPQIFVLLDCDKPESYDVAYNFASLVKEAINGIAPVRIVNFFKETGEKDLTDLIRKGKHKEDINLITGTISKSEAI